ncbi:MAG: DUF2262 domain-containing protein [Verrucomicrobiota bacterium]
MNQWKCSQCGELNDDDVDFCFGCGRYAEKAPPIPPPEKNKPPTDLGEPVHDVLFGNIYWSPEIKKWVGVYPPAADSPYELRIEAPRGKDAPISEVMRTSMQNLIRLLSELPKNAAKDLMPLFADWNPDEEPITEEEFVRRLSPGGITVRADGTVDFWFNDYEEMFGGHWLVTTINQDETVEEFDLQG